MKRLGKGVSPIIATIILVLIAIAAGVMLWLWVSGFITSTPAQQPALNERIKIDAVNISNSKSKLSIYVRNIGSTNVNITAAYILTTSNTAIAYQTYRNVTILPGQVTTIDMNIPTDASANIKSGYAYVAKVVTANGVEATYTFVWP
uniref:Flagellar biosynthesis protein FlaG n=1 Tax=Ignisphaera aggregans TaxID=334771 RepID=A0A7J2U4M5_9CREN